MVINSRCVRAESWKSIVGNVTIIDKDDTPVVSLDFFDKVLVVNGRYELNEKGWISYDCNAENRIRLPLVSKIKVKNEDRMFKMRVDWWGHKHEFEVHKEAAILVDPQSKIVSRLPMEQSVEPETDLNANALPNEALVMVEQPVGFKFGK